MAIEEHNLGKQLLGVSNCPHCGITAPLIVLKWASDGHLPRTDGGRTRKWAAFACTSCGSLISVEGSPDNGSSAPPVIAMYPTIWSAKASIPERARTYLNQAMQTLAQPDASVVMSASSIDAMLKDKGLENGSLYARINQAVEQGIVTQGMADWAHRVRLDANSPRHADANDPHMTRDDADRAFEYAKTLAEILYVLPSRMPADPGDGD